MKHTRTVSVAILLLASGLSAAAPANTARGTGARITLANGDTMSGRVTGIESGIVGIVTDFTARELRVPLRAVAEVRFPAPRPLLPTESDHVLLLGGDRLSGRLLRMDRDTITLETSYAPAFLIRRDVVDALMVSNPPRIVFEDDRPGSSDKWSAVAKEPPNLRMTRFEQKDAMTYELSGPEPGLWLTFLGERPIGTWCYRSYWITTTMHNGRGYTNLDRIERSSNLPLARWGIQRTGTQSKLTVTYDAATRTIRAWFDTDDPVIVATDSSLRKTGPYVRIGGGLSHMRVTHQYVLYPEMRKGSEERDVLSHPESGTRISGQLDSIDAGSIRFHASQAEAQLDRGEAYFIVMRRASIVPRGGNPNSVTLTFQNGDRLSVDVSTMDEEVLSFRVPGTGQMQVDRSAIAEMRFGGH